MNNDIQHLNTRPPKVIKARLWHLNGVESEITMTVPVYNTYSEMQELGCSYLRSYVLHLTRCFIQISHYQIFVEGGIEYPIEEIPAGKVFIASNNRRKEQWVDPSQYNHQQMGLIMDGYDPGNLPV